QSFEMADRPAATFNAVQVDIDGARLAGDDASQRAEQRGASAARSAENKRVSDAAEVEYQWLLPLRPRQIDKSDRERQRAAQLACQPGVIDGDRVRQRRKPGMPQRCHIRHPRRVVNGVDQRGERRTALTVIVAFTTGRTSTTSARADEIERAHAD